MNAPLVVSNEQDKITGFDTSVLHPVQNGGSDGAGIGSGIRGDGGASTELLRVGLDFRWRAGNARRVLWRGNAG